MTEAEYTEIREFLKTKNYYGLRNSELPIFLKQFLKGELGRKYEECWQHDILGSFYESIFSPDEMRDIQNALLWLEELKGLG